MKKRETRVKKIKTLLRLLLSPPLQRQWVELGNLHFLESGVKKKKKKKV